MIGGLLFRYWEGGTAVRSGNPNVYVNWAQKKRPAQQPPAPKATELEQAVLVPLPAVCGVGRVTTNCRSPVVFARQTKVEAATGTVGMPGPQAWAVLQPVPLAAATARGVLSASANAPDVLAVMDAESHRRLAVVEHNRRAIAAIAAAMLADDT